MEQRDLETKDLNQEIQPDDNIKQEEFEKMTKSEVNLPDNRNAKEKLYDKIPVSLKTLDIFIAICVIALVVLMVYFIIRRYY